MNMVETEDTSDEEFKMSWNELNDAFGKTWCMKCSKSESHSSGCNSFAMQYYPKSFWLQVAIYF